MELILNDTEGAEIQMSWALIDDQSTFHAKVVKAGNSAWGACVRMITWSSGQLSDGVIPTHIASLIATEEELKALLGVGLLERSTEGFYIHDYLEWNRSAEEIKKQRAHLSEIRSKAGKKGGTSKAKNAKVNNNTALANEVAKPKQNSVALSSPLHSNNKKEICGPTDHQKVLNHFHDTFFRLKGSKPVITSLEGKAAKQLLELLEVDQIIPMIERAFDDPWYVKNKSTLHHIASYPNQYIGSQTAIEPPEPEVVYFKPDPQPLDRPDPEMVKEFFAKMENLGKYTG